MENSQITLKLKYHRRVEVIFICYTYDYYLNNLVKTIPNRKWSRTLKYWYVPNTQDALDHIKKALSYYSIDDSALKQSSATKHQNDAPKLSLIQNQLIQNYTKYLEGKRYSKSTLELYIFGW